MRKYEAYNADKAPSPPPFPRKCFLGLCWFQGPGDRGKGRAGSGGRIPRAGPQTPRSTHAPGP
eukprot:4263355-Pyramimonas_sp.AAC.1